MVNWYRFGDFVQTPAITADTMRAVFETARSRVQPMRGAPAVALASVLDRVGQRLADPGDPARQEILDVMPAQISFSREMILAGLDAICWILQHEHLMQRLAVDLDRADYVDNFVWNERFRGFVRAVPRGIVSHVSAGNVFVSAVDTLVQGIMTKNVNILKMSSFDPVFPLLFARLVQECDPRQLIAPNMALLPFKGGDVEVEAVVKQESDVVIVYGGAEVVEVYRRGRGLHTRELEFGPKYSLAVLDAGALAASDPAALALEMARDFTMWEQAACSSPHAVFIHGQDQARRFADQLAQALAQLAQEFPFPPIDRNEQTEITRTRELARVDQALGKAQLSIPGNADQSWTVILEKQPCFKVSCQHRTAFVVAIEQDSEMFEVLQPYGSFIQSIGILADGPRLFELSERFAALGADRITEIGHMHRRKHGTPHDGTRGLAELVRWASIGHARRFDEPLDYLPEAQRDAITLARLNHVLDVARSKSPFYRERLPKGQLDSLAELARLPILESSEFRAHLPPQGEGLLTAPLGHSISFASGGTTGQPKFVYRTMEETGRNADAMAKSLGLALFEEGDVVANLFYAGNMWASFISVNMALERIGAHILPIGGHIPLENIVSLLRGFKVDGAISIPSVLLGIAQYVEKHQISDLTIRKIGYGGEHMPQAVRDYVASVLKTEIIQSASYAINDTGVAGYQCPASTGAIHHVSEELHVLEIVDPETGAPLPDGEEGDIILTNIDRTLMPVIRYRVGDRGRIVPGPCACGRSTRRFELLGRSDDVLVIAGDNITIDAIAACVARVPALSQYFALHGRRHQHLDQLEVRVESNAPLPAAECERLAALLLAEVLHEKPALASGMANGTTAEPRVSVVTPQSLARNPRTGKLKRIIDERSAA
ncbi:MAG: aldehyde dehydrogenase family protein [Ottowia sp.]|nr:aldehyde dehydrogenase family protein [Ottowia sp.]